MKENNRTEVLCLCRKCKGIVWLDPHDDGRVEAHLLMTGFMDGYTRWIIEDEGDDVEDAKGAGNDDTRQDEEMIDNGGGEEAGMAAEKGPDMAEDKGHTWQRRRGRTWRQREHGLHAAEFVGTKFNRAGPSCSSIASQGDEY